VTKSTKFTGKIDFGDAKDKFGLGDGWIMYDCDLVAALEQPMLKIAKKCIEELLISAHRYVHLAINDDGEPVMGFSSDFIDENENSVFIDFKIREIFDDFINEFPKSDLAVLRTLLAEVVTRIDEIPDGES